MSKESTRNEGDTGDSGSIPGLGRPPEEGNGSPLQYSCLENSVDRGAWWAIVIGVAELDMTKQLTLSLLVKSEKLQSSHCMFIICLVSNR